MHSNYSSCIRGSLRALDLAHPSCLGSGSLTASVQPSLLLFRCMAASVHCYSQSVLVSVCISRQGPKGCTLLAMPAAYSSRVCHEIQNDRAVARRHWSLVWRWACRNCQLVSDKLSLKHLPQSSPYRLQHKNRTHIALILLAQLHQHALFFPWKSLPAASSRLAVAAGKACTTSKIPAASLSMLLPSIVPKKMLVWGHCGFLASCMAIRSEHTRTKHCRLEPFSCNPIRPPKNRPRGR
jgi:hypothetical protein